MIRTRPITAAPFLQIMIEGRWKKFSKSQKGSKYSYLFHREKSELDSLTGPDLPRSDEFPNYRTMRPPTATSGMLLLSAASRPHQSWAKTLVPPFQRSKSVGAARAYRSEAPPWRRSQTGR